MVHDNIPRGMRNHIRQSIRDLEKAVEPVNDTLDTLQRLARPLIVGLDGEFRALDELILKIKERWAYFEAHDGWPESGEALNPVRASASAPPRLSEERDEQEREPTTV